MKDDATEARYRAMVRAKLERIEREELARAGLIPPDPLKLTPSPSPLPYGTTGLSVPTAEHKPYRIIRYPAGTLVSVNREYHGQVAAPGSVLIRVWDAIVQHLGDKEVSRRQLTEDLVTLGYPRASLSPQITHLIDRGALLHRMHRIGEAYRG